MIGIYYTGANKFLDSQIDAKDSLGNYVSSSKIPNSLRNNIFTEITPSIQQKGLKETRCIVLKNEGDTNITQIDFTVNKSASSLGILSGFFVLPAIGDCGGSYFEKLVSRFSKPTIGTFTDLENSNVIQVNLTLLPGQYLGLWLHREVPYNDVFPSLDCPECDILHDNYNNKTPKIKQETYSLNFDYS